MPLEGWEGLPVAGSPVAGHSWIGASAESLAPATTSTYSAHAAVYAVDDNDAGLSLTDALVSGSLRGDSGSAGSPASSCWLSGRR
jgi:hypothetical protein